MIPWQQIISNRFGVKRLSKKVSGTFECFDYCLSHQNLKKVILFLNGLIFSFPSKTRLNKENIGDYKSQEKI